VAEQQIELGTIWLDRKFFTDDPTWRRLVEVIEVDSRYVHAVGRVQQQVDGAWQDTPQTSRRTRVLRDAFRRQYRPLEEM
jgi:hypothetical protein